MIYKFHKDNEYLRSLLGDCTLWFSNVKDFNDPYEGLFRYRLSPESTPELRAFVEGENVGRSAAEIQKRIEYYQLNPMELQKRLNKPIIHMAQSNGVCCFSAQRRRDSILMWSHYADSHKGVCVGFANRLKIFASQDSSGILMGNPCMPKPIEYVINYPIRDPFHPKKFSATRLLWTKFDLWKDEAELRSIAPKKGLYYFHVRQLREVIFGSRMTEESKQAIQRLIQSNPQLAHVELFEAKLYRSKFALKIAPLESK